MSVVVVVLPLGTSVVWSAGGMGGLQVDPAYEGMAGFLLPGEVAGAPVDATMSVDGPRARPGFASVLVHMDPAARGNSAERANVRAFAAAHGGFVKHEYHVVMPDVINVRNVPEGQIARQQCSVARLG